MSGILNQYLEDWAKSAQRANSDAESYNNTLMMGSDGKPIGEKDGYYSKNAPRGFSAPYGMLTPSPKDPSVNMVRQNPTSTNDTRVYYTPVGENGMYSNDGGTTLYRARAIDDSGAVVLEGPDGQQISAGGNGNGYMTGDVTYTFPDQPEAFTKKRPTFTAAQEQQLGQPTEDVAMSDMERGGNGIISRLLERKNEQD